MDASMGVCLCLVWTLDEISFWIWSFNRYIDMGNTGNRCQDLKRLVIIINFNHPASFVLIPFSN